MNDLETTQITRRRATIRWSHALCLFALSLAGCAGDDGTDPSPAEPTSSTTGAETSTGRASDDGDSTTAPDSSGTDDDATDTSAGTTGEEPPPVDLCLNQADQAVLDGIDAEMVANGCATQNVGDVEGAVQCMVDDTGLSMECAACFGLTIGCVFEMCLPACLDPASDDCVDCRTTHCDPPFLACSGL